MTTQTTENCIIVSALDNGVDDGVDDGVDLDDSVGVDVLRMPITIAK